MRMDLVNDDDSDDYRDDDDHDDVQTESEERPKSDREKMEELFLINKRKRVDTSESDAQLGERINSLFMTLHAAEEEWYMVGWSDQRVRERWMRPQTRW